MTSDAALILSAAFGAGLAARILHLPPLLGFLAAGFALAAAGVEQSPTIALLADLGVTLLLFAVGLHLDVRRLVRREVWLTTTLHSVLMIGVGVAFLTALSALGVAEAAGLDLRAIALVALALSFSSTVFVVKVLDERSESRSRYGQLAIGILVVQDVFAVVFVAMSQGSPPSPWALALLALIPARRLFIIVWERAGRAVLATVLVARDDDPADLAVVRPLGRRVELSRPAVQPLDGEPGERGLVTQPDRGREDDDVGRLDEPLVEVGEVVALPPVLAHVRLHPRRDDVVDQAHDVDPRADTAQDVGAHVEQPVGVAGLGRALEGAVEVDGPQVGEVGPAGGDLGVDEALDGVGEHAPTLASAGQAPYAVSSAARFACTRACTRVPSASWRDSSTSPCSCRRLTRSPRL